MVFNEKVVTNTVHEALGIMTNHQGALLVNVKRTLEQMISLQQSYASPHGNWGPREKNRVVLHSVKMVSSQVYDSY